MVLDRREIADRLRRSFKGSICLTGIKEVRAEGQYLFYVCPCGGKDHWATRCRDVSEPPMFPEGLSRVLHCWETGKQWLIVESWEFTATIIHREERRYHALLDRAPKTIARYLAKKALTADGLRDEHYEDLHSTHGLDKETVQGVLFGEGKNVDEWMRERNQASSAKVTKK